MWNLCQNVPKTRTDQKEPNIFILFFYFVGDIFIKNMHVALKTRKLENEDILYYHNHHYLKSICLGWKLLTFPLWEETYDSICHVFAYTHVYVKYSLNLYAASCFLTYFLLYSSRRILVQQRHCWLEEVAVTKQTSLFPGNLDLLRRPFDRTLKARIFLHHHVYLWARWQSQSAATGFVSVCVLCSGRGNDGCRQDLKIYLRWVNTVLIRSSPHMIIPLKRGERISHPSASCVSVCVFCGLCGNAGCRYLGWFNVAPSW